MEGNKRNWNLLENSVADSLRLCCGVRSEVTHARLHSQGAGALAAGPERSDKGIQEQQTAPPDAKRSGQ